MFGAKKSSGDYHEEMNGYHYEKWFIKKLLPLLPPGSVIVMDNAPERERRHFVSNHGMLPRGTQLAPPSPLPMAGMTGDHENWGCLRLYAVIRQW